jgi:hypothetical protein
VVPSVAPPIRGSDMFLHYTPSLPAQGNEALVTLPRTLELTQPPRELMTPPPTPPQPSHVDSPSYVDSPSLELIYQMEQHNPAEFKLAATLYQCDASGGDLRDIFYFYLIHRRETVRQMMIKLRQCSKCRNLFKFLLNKMYRCQEGST